MSVWREVQEVLYGAFQTGWADATPFVFDNETYALAGVAYCRFRVQQMPGTPGTLGSPGNRKMDRQGMVFAILQCPPGQGVGELSDLAEKARGLFEMKKFQPHGIYFAQGDIGTAAEIDAGRWWGVTTSVPFRYEELI